MKRIILLAVAAVALLLAVGLWFGGREVTLLKVVDYVARQTRGALEVTSVTGSLYGPIHIGRLVYRSGGNEIAIDDATVDWAPRRLLGAQIYIDPLRVKSAVLKLSGTATGAPELPQSLVAPLAFVLPQARIDRLMVTSVSGASEFSDITFALRGDRTHWSGKIDSVQTPWGRAHGTLEMETRNPFALRGELQMSQTSAPAYSAACRLGGSLMRLEATATAQANGAVVTPTSC